MKDLIRTLDLSPADFKYVLSQARKLKADARARTKLLAGESICLCFRAPSSLARVVLQNAIARLGAAAIVVGREDGGALADGHSLEDAARTLSRLTRAFVIHAFADQEVAAFARAASVPVVNALSAAHEPCQSIADLFTLLERRGSFKNCRIAYIGEGNAVAASLMEAAALAGADITLATPKAYAIAPERVEDARRVAAESGSSVEVGEDPEQAVRGADALYTCASELRTELEHDLEARRRALAPYQATRRWIELAKPDAVLLRCLPALRDEALTAPAFEEARSVFYDQAENGAYVLAAVLFALLKGKLEGRSV